MQTFVELKEKRDFPSIVTLCDVALVIDFVPTIETL